LLGRSFSSLSSPFAFIYLDNSNIHVKPRREEREKNIHVHDGIDEEAFVAMRNARDKTLSMPVLILPSVQVNIRAGHMPPPESDGNT
jgi:hypothetical protein